jgi:hypothetical protein
VRKLDPTEQPMKRCELQTPHGRETVAAVWQHLRDKFPSDAHILELIVKSIVPLRDVEIADGTRGEWVAISFATFEEEKAFYSSVSEAHGRGYGIIKLMDTDDLTIKDVAHELGHAFTSDEDLVERGGPDEWASEAAADMHAVRWGLLTLEDIRQRYQRNTAHVGQEIGNPAWIHHGPPPGGGWIENDGARWWLQEDFVFVCERVIAPT